MMNLPKSFVTILALAAIIVMSIAAIEPAPPHFKNLKVLPQDIPGKTLDSLMDTYCKALNVNCEFCHVKPKEIFPITPLSDNQVDFALDNEMKEEARKMMRLTININDTYFRHDTTTRREYLNVVTCNTCHRGNPYPAHE